MIQKWEDRIRERELAEKRRVAPGWLDVGVEERMLVPERRDGHGHSAGGGNSMDVEVTGAGAERMELDSRAQDEGEELDRAFGGLGIR